MSERKIRVLIVDDSDLIIQLIQTSLSNHPRIEVVGSAKDGMQAIQMMPKLRPDVVTLDVEMPRMNGIQVLERAGGKVPCSFLMVSTLTRAGAQITLEALEKGAVDYITKPKEGAVDRATFKSVLVTKILSAFQARGKRKVLNQINKSTAPTLPPCKVRGWVIGIGISCGGPQTLHQMLPAFPSDFPPIVVTQHMPAGFTTSFASHLNSSCAMNVKEGAQGETLSQGTIYIAPGHSHMKIVRRGIQLSIQLDRGGLVAGHMPSADVMFKSLAASLGNKTVGVIMTGMGKDGVSGMGALKQRGARTLGQDEASSIVYGMPRAAHEAGFVQQQFALKQIPSAIAKTIGAPTGRAVGV